MKQERTMLIGAVGAGKTSLLNVLNQTAEPASKTQSLEYHPCSIDTPGEFIENPNYYSALFSTSLEATRLLFVQDATSKVSVFPPGFAQAFSKHTMGVVTKIDHPHANVQHAKEVLKKMVLSGPILAISAFTGEGIEELKRILNWNNSTIEGRPVNDFKG